MQLYFYSAVTVGAPKRRGRFNVLPQTVTPGLPSKYKNSFCTFFCNYTNKYRHCAICKLKHVL